VSSATQQPPDLADPFGRIPPTGRSLAPRPADLNGRTVVLFNNSKLDPEWGELGVIFEVVEAALRSTFPGASIVTVSLDLLGTGKDPLGAGFTSILDHAPAAVVLALADIGVSQRTVELALRLEARGIATCTIAAPPGGGFARAVAAIQLPGLPIVELAVSNTSPRQAASALASRETARVIEALTRPADAAHATTAMGVEMPGELTGATGCNALTTAESYYEALSTARLGDGLPVILPRRHAVDAMIATVARSPDEVLFTGLVPSGIPVTVERLAANAVMAGCRPEWFPVVLTAFEAMTAPGYRLAQAAITTHPGANLVMVSGPMAEALGISGGAGCLGPGHRANLTIGRALNLTLTNVGRIRPGEADLGSFGSMGEIACCFAENLAASPWGGFNEDHYDRNTSCVLVHRTEFPHAAVDTLSTRPEPILDIIASVAATFGGNSLYNPAELVMLLNPEHARLMAGCGWGKKQVREYLFSRMQIPAAKVIGRGIGSNRGRPIDPEEMLSVVNSADDIVIAVAGGPGPHSMVAVPWGARLSHRRI
jgi:hypothetical protein